MIDINKNNNLMEYNKIFKTISIPGQELIRDPKTLKKLIKYEDGTTVPFAPKQWQISNIESSIMLAETGLSKIIAIDFDGPEGDKYFDMAIKLDPNCKYIAKGIGKGGGHLIYKTGGTETLDSVITSPNGCKVDGLDLQRGRKLILLATSGNKTKQLITPPLESYDDLTTIPVAIQLLINNIYLKNRQIEIKTEQGIDTSIHKDSKLYNIVKTALLEPTQYNHKLFNIITTPQYKSLLSKNAKDNTDIYHPNNLPRPGANSYLVSIATILGRDISIDQDTFIKTINYVNGLFDRPHRADDTNNIITYITSGKSKIKGVSVWNYDPNWNKQGMIYIDNKDNSHEIFISAVKGGTKYIDHNHVTNEYIIYDTAGALIDMIKASSNVGVDKAKILKRTKPVKLLEDPMVAFGNNDKDEFNLYKRSEELEIFMQPERYKNRYKKPEMTLKALENSMGKSKLYNFFLPFMKRKLLKREFSPLILVLYGPPHSGKSFIPNGILAPLMAGRRQTLSPEILTEKYNDWKLNKDIVFIDEIHNMPSNLQKTVIGEMNKISGASEFTDIRAMHSSISSEEYPNTITFIVACNDVVQLVSETQDRRTVILRSKQKMSKALGLSDDKIRFAIKNETKDFAYYLATEVEELDGARYNDNEWLKDEDYKEFHRESLPFNKALVQIIDRLDFKALEDILAERNIDITDIVKCSQIVKNDIHIRLFNTKPQDSHSPAILDNINIDVNNTIRMLKEVYEADRTKLRIKTFDTKNGDKKLNKKTVAIFPIRCLTRDFIDRVKIASVQPLPNGENIEF